MHKLPNKLIKQSTRHTLAKRLAVCEAGANNLNLKNLLFPFWWDMMFCSSCTQN